jgi:hypothetical protein
LIFQGFREQSATVVRKWEDITGTTMNDPKPGLLLISLVRFKRDEDLKKEMKDYLANFKEIIAKDGIRK